MFSINVRRRDVAAAVLVVAAATVTSLSGVAGAAPYSVAPASEFMLLPKFCWGQFTDDLKGSEYKITNCGAGVNHYCDGLLDLQRSKKTRNANDRRTMLIHARDNTLYTIRWLKQEGVAESCPIAAHINGTLQEVELKIKLYGIK